MLEHQLLVLQKVDANRKLFKKELKKSLGWLSDDEIEILKNWVCINYKNKYSDLIREFFGEVAV